MSHRHVKSNDINQEVQRQRVTVISEQKAGPELNRLKTTDSVDRDVAVSAPDPPKRSGRDELGGAEGESDERGELSEIHCNSGWKLECLVKLQCSTCQSL